MMITDNQFLSSFYSIPCSLCNHPYNDFLFATVNLHTVKATPIACISKNVTVQMDEWISSFSCKFPLPIQTPIQLYSAYYYYELIILILYRSTIQIYPSGWYFIRYWFWRCRNWRRAIVGIQYCEWENHSQH